MFCLIFSLFSFNKYKNTGSVQTFTAPSSTTYKLEVWGAQGGWAGYPRAVDGGKGGYSKGNSSLSANVTVYICVGGEGIGSGSSGDKTNGGIPAANAGGYNGGGRSTAWGNTSHGSGGGATHIAIKTGLLSSLASSKSNVLIVAGGGGGSASDIGTVTTGSGKAKGGNGGGNNGTRGDNPPNDDGSYGQGGSQSGGGTSIRTGSLTGAQRELGKTGGFGYGGNGSDNHGGAGGGAGWYGGGGSSVWGGAGGGSGYIGGVSNGITENAKREGNGYAVISWHPNV